MKSWGRVRGAIIGKQHAEGYCQHLGHAYPRDNLLRETLGELVHTPTDESEAP